MTPHRLQLVSLADPSALAARARDEVLQRAECALAERGAFRIALAGGSTPRLLYRLLAEARADFARWHVFFSDERCVPPQHEESNFRMASEAWLARGGVPGAQIHRVRGEADATAAAAEYEREIALAFRTTDVPRFDVVLLGMGADGHTASLFPGTTALEDTRNFVAATWVEKLAAHRVTFTVPAINAAHCVMFMVAGVDKAAMLRTVLRGDEAQAHYPVRRVQPTNGELLWLVDRAAASELAHDD